MNVNRKTTLFVLAAIALVVAGQAALADYWSDRKKAAEGYVGDRVKAAKDEGAKWYRVFTQKGSQVENLEGADIVVFEHVDCDGRCRGFKVGDRDELRKLVSATPGTNVGASYDSSRGVKVRPFGSGGTENWEDVISCVSIKEDGVEVILYSGREFDRESITVKGRGMHNLYNFNDRARSIQVIRKN